MKQKFGKLSFVRISDKLPANMKHFDCGFDAIVEGTYSQMYGGTDIDSYSVYKIKNGKIVDNISWYHEEHLTLLPDQDKDKAEEMIEEFNLQEEEDEDFFYVNMKTKTIKKGKS